MRAIKIDVNRNPVIKNGSIQWVYDADVVKQNCDQAMRQQLGELNYAKDKGIDYINDVYSGSPNFQRFEAKSRTQILNVPGVTGINSFDYDLITTNNVNVLEYSIEISTIYGAITASDLYEEEVVASSTTDVDYALIASQKWVNAGIHYSITFGV